MRQSGPLGRLKFVAAFTYLAIGFGIFLTAADNYLGKTGKLPIPSTVAALGFLLSVVAFTALSEFLVDGTGIRTSVVLRSNIAAVLPFGALALLSLLLGLHPEAYWGDGWKWIFLQSYDFTVFLAAMLVPTSPLVRRHFHTLVTIALLTLLGSIAYEVQYPGTFSTVPNRAAGFPTNSNWSALATVMLCSMALRHRDGPARLMDMVVLALTGLGLYFTLSRSGFMNFALLAGSYVAVAVYTNRHRLQSIMLVLVSAGALVLSLLIIIPLAASSSNLMAGSKAQNRLIGMFSGEIVDDGSAADRLEAAHDAMNKIDSSPLIGHGTGFNRRLRQTPHDLYLKLWLDGGMLGVLIWITLLGSSFWMFTARKFPQGQTFIQVVAFGALFSHNVLEERTFLLLFGMGSTVSLYASAGAFRRREGFRQLFRGPVPSLDPCPEAA